MRCLTIEEKLPVFAEHFLRSVLCYPYERFFRYSMEAGHTWDELVEEVIERAMPLRYASGRPRPDWRGRLLRGSPSRSTGNETALPHELGRGSVARQ